ncbi:uncharacterized protein LOC132751931, partial [Ruditapes philippinarum]|uniref:uncharacterized protein LOC132751931 n=1 Tax=Ruditapes philippinarum TaxID=129788 RepID=UPI00295AFFB3
MINQYSNRSKVHVPKRRNSTSVLEDLDGFGNDVLNYDIYQKALSEGVENDKTIRVNVVGNFAQGKTSLTNILVGKQSQDVPSTNGVEIIHCKYSNDHEDIKFCSKSTSPGDEEYHRRIASLIRIEKDGIKSIQSKDNSRCVNLNEASTNSQVHVRKTGVEMYTRNSCHQSRDFLKVSMLVDMNQCDPFYTGGDLQFWDFGGQFIFYATHTLFHSKTSVYLMVFDLTKSLSAIVEDTEFPNESVKKSIQQYAEFWMRSIHSYVGSDDGLQPPVILVGTHKDLLEGDDNMRQKLADDYFDKIRKLFDDTPIINHIQAKDFAVDCTNPSNSSIVELRKEIIRLGANLEGKKIPARWLPLEKELLAVKHKKIILYSEVEEIDAQNAVPLTDKEHIKVFLLYQHAKGNLFYFDEEPLSAYIALDTQYVIDAFRCIITSERFCKKDPTCRRLWKTLTQEAKLERQLLERVWSNDAKNNFLEHKDILLMLMQRHHIISEALSYDEETEEIKGLGWYVVPCFLRTYISNYVLKEFVTGRQKLSEF